MEQGRRILSSRLFAKSAQLRNLLEFLVMETLEGRASTLKEYRLGAEVLGRGAQFDPRIDPAVRLQMSKLRSRLAEYYASEGSSDPILIQIPRGGYVPEFSQQAVAAASFTARASEPSIVVLPFVSLSSRPEDECFTNGLTDELINCLASVPGLRVVARSTAYLFKSERTDVRSIGERLRVEYVVEGSVRKVGNAVRIAVQLVDAAEGYQVCSHAFQRELDDIFSLQVEVCASLVAHITKRVGVTLPAPTHHTQTRNLEAYQAYLKARHIHTHYMGESFQLCIDYFRQAVELDPNFAEAWAGLADSYTLQAWYGLCPADGVRQSALDAALHAIELDDRLPEAHNALGCIRCIFEWEWAAGEASYRRAMQLAPGDGDSRLRYALLCLLPRRRFEEAVRAVEYSLGLSPFDPYVHASTIYTYAAAGQLSEAIRHYELASDICQPFGLISLTAGHAFEQARRFEEALAAFEEACRLTSDQAFTVASLAHLHATTGRPELARAALESLMQRPDQAYYIAVVHSGLRDREGTLRWLHKAIEYRAPALNRLPFEYRFEWLNTDPEFLEFFSRMGLDRPAQMALAHTGL